MLQLFLHTAARPVCFRAAGVIEKKTLTSRSIPDMSSTLPRVSLNFTIFAVDLHLQEVGLHQVGPRRLREDARRGQAAAGRSQRAGEFVDSTGGDPEYFA